MNELKERQSSVPFILGGEEYVRKENITQAVNFQSIALLDLVAAHIAGDTGYAPEWRMSEDCSYVKVISNARRRNKQDATDGQSNFIEVDVEILLPAEKTQLFNSVTAKADSRLESILKDKRENRDQNPLSPFEMLAAEIPTFIEVAQKELAELKNHSSE